MILIHWPVALFSDSSRYQFNVIELVVTFVEVNVGVVGGSEIQLIAFNSFVTWWILISVYLQPASAHELFRIPNLHLCCCTAESRFRTWCFGADFSKQLPVWIAIAQNPTEPNWPYSSRSRPFYTCTDRPSTTLCSRCNSLECGRTSKTVPDSAI